MPPSFREHGATVASLLSLLSACGAAEDAPPPRAPVQNLLLVSIDTLRADHLGCYGYERQTTPRIDRLAAEGTVFLEAISSASWTVPAHMTMMTGLDAKTHGLTRYPAPGRLGPEATTLAEVLEAAGFRTAAFTGGGFVSRRHGFDRGFATFESMGRRFEANLGDALAWVRSVPEDRRFFLFLHGFDVHGPYTTRGKYRRMFFPQYRGDFDVKDFHPANPRPSEQDLKYVLSQYDGAIRAADDALGGFIDGLRAQGRLDNTLVVITADHGEEMYEHGTIEHTHSLYDEVVRVPLIFVGPHVPAARDVRSVGLVDLFPSVLDLLAVTARHPVQGAPLFPSDEREDSSEERPVFTHVAYSKYPYTIDSVRTADWKLLVWTLSGMADVDLEASAERERYTFRFLERTDDFVELYDLNADPGETTDVSGRFSEVVERLRARLEQHTLATGRIRHAPVDSLRADERYLEDMRALGYAE